MKENQRAWLRPHFHRKGQEVFFLLSRRLTVRLAEDELALFDALDHPLDRTEALALHPQADCLLDKWWASQLVEFLPLPRPLPSDSHLVVIEPHMDDAALSVGGSLLLQRAQRRITLLTVCGVSNFTSYWYSDRSFFDPREVSHLRQRESVLVAEALQAKHVWMNVLEAPLRFARADAWSRESYPKFQRSLSAFTTHLPRHEEILQLAKPIASRLTELAPDEVWFPLGIGRHVDHVRTREATLAALHEPGVMANSPAILAYEDVPYAARYPEHREGLREVLSALGMSWSEEEVDITRVLPEKLRLVSIYGSQFKLSALESEIRKSSQKNQDHEHFVERFLRISNLPSGMVGRRGAANRALALRGDSAKRRLIGLSDANQVDILAISAFGRLPEVISALLSSFPSTRFHFYTSARDAMEHEGVSHPRVRIDEIQSGLWHWIPRILQLARPSRRSIILLSGHTRSWQKLILKSLLCLRPVIVLASPTDLLPLLDELLQVDRVDPA